MALVSDLVSAIAEVEGIPEPTVALAARHAREAGLLSQGARGRNAPRATVTDCANLLIGVNASGCVVKDTPAAIESYRRLQLRSVHGGVTLREDSAIYSDICHEDLKFLEESRWRTFGDVFEAIIERFIKGDLEAFILKEASKYIGPPHIEDMKREVGDDKAALTERIIAASRSLASMVTFEFSFRRPIPLVKLRISHGHGVREDLLAEAHFLLSDEDILSGKANFWGDRREVTTIGYNTMLRVAEVMRDGASGHRFILSDLE